MTKTANLDLDQQIETLVHDLRYEHRAEQIVRAVNSHAALVEAVVALRAELDTYYCMDEHEADQDVESALDKADAALTLAKGA